MERGENIIHVLPCFTWDENRNTQSRTRLPMGGLLNDRYELDGRDPKGYTGIAWALAGKHDRPSFERPGFGQVRYMSLASIGRKFDSKNYIAQIGKLDWAHV